MSTVPTSTDGQKVRAGWLNTYVRDNLSAFYRTNAYKTADETVSASTTKQDDDHLFVNLVGGYDWAFRLFLVTTATGAPQIISAALSFSGAFSTTYISVQTENLASPGQIYFQDRTTFNDSTGAFDVAATSASSRCGFVDGIVRGVTVGGVLRLRWAQATGLNSSTIKAGSSMMAYAVP